MEHLWSPWRYDYMASAGKQKTSACVFCVGDNPAQDAERLIVFRGKYNFIILNLFPYTSGHLMIAPYAHIGAITDAAVEQTSEMMELSKRAVTALQNVYNPDGFNIGMNLGHSAGAGVRDHLHMHVVPRWIGDANFIGVIGETRVLPEELSTTYRRVQEQLAA